MPSQLELAIQAYRTRLLARETQATQTVLRGYAAIRSELIASIEALTKEIGTRELTAGEAFRLQRAQDLLDQVATRMSQLAGGTQRVITTSQADVIALAESQALGLAVAQSATVASVWNRLPTDAVETMIGKLSDGSPLSDLLGTFGTETSTKIGTALRDGIAQGLGPREIADALTRVTDVDAKRLLTITRTEILGSARSAQRESAIQNQDVLSGTVWICDLSSDTCAACLAMSGRRFSVDYVMESHPRCRCTLAPEVRGIPFPQMKTGDEFFAGLDADKQDAVLGSKSAGVAYRSGEVTLKDFAYVRPNERWGGSVQVNSLKGAREAATRRAS